MPAIIASNRDYTDKASSGNDSAVLVVGTQEPNSVFLNCQFLAPVGCEWGAKMPGNTGSRFTDCLFDCEDGERTLDIVQGSDLGFTRCHFTYPDPIKTRFSLRKQCSIGIKGGFRGAFFDECVMNDILLGDYSIYDHDSACQPVSGIELHDCCSASGGPIIIRALNADAVKLTGTTKAIVLQVPKPLWEIYYAV